MAGNRERFYDNLQPDMLAATQLLRLKQAAHDAVLCEAATKVPAELTVAQWALESGWGAHQPGNNCFGIKAFDGCGGVQTVSTKEYLNGEWITAALEFAVFPTLAGCFQKHADLVSGAKPYSKVWARYLQDADVTALVQGVAPIYATDPGYAHLLFSIMGMPQVKQSLAEFRKALSSPATAPEITSPSTEVGAD